jgi:hypothetical protein
MNFSGWPGARRRKAATACGTQAVFAARRPPGGTPAEWTRPSERRPRPLRSCWIKAESTLSQLDRWILLSFPNLRWRSVGFKGSARRVGRCSIPRRQWLAEARERSFSLRTLARSLLKTDSCDSQSAVLDSRTRCERRVSPPCPRHRRRFSCPDRPLSLSALAFRFVTGLWARSDALFARTEVRELLHEQSRIVSA